MRERRKKITLCKRQRNAVTKGRRKSLKKRQPEEGLQNPREKKEGKTINPT
jgi:hypothetical protein